MIGHLRGQILEKQPPYLLLEVNGVGYELEAPMSTFYELPECGVEVALYTHLLVREDAQKLYAFKTLKDRSLFRNLLKVNGVGAKMALVILSGMDSNAFANCIRSADADSLIRLPGVGRKTAERLIIDMRDRLEKDGANDKSSNGANGTAYVRQNPVEEAVSALISLGYKPNEASRMVSKIDSQEQNSEDIIRLALKSQLS